MKFATSFLDEPQPKVRCCDVPGCPGEGLFRAPKSRDRLNEYFWFCLEHIREYNRSWDYFAGMSQAEIEAHLRGDVTWHRPTWPMGSWRAREERLREAAMRDFRFGPDGTGPAGRRAHSHAGEGHRPGRDARSPELEALAVLNLTPPVEFSQIKARYRELVKAHHPDANGGDKAAEEKLKRINQAYSTLKASYVS